MYFGIIQINLAQKTANTHIFFIYMWNTNAKTLVVAPQKNPCGSLQTYNTQHQAVMFITAEITSPVLHWWYMVHCDCA